jgi:hypothetical protein
MNSHFYHAQRLLHDLSFGFIQRNMGPKTALLGYLCRSTPKYSNKIGMIFL